MRLLHTADWHIGKRLYGNDRLEETRRVLDEVATIARAAEVDAILVAGDNLDRRLVEPPVLATCLHAFEALAAVAPVVAVTGNHEDAAFWAELAPYLAPRILLAAADAVLPVDTAAGRLWAACLPWPEPAGVPTDAGVDRETSRSEYTAMVGEQISALAETVRALRADTPAPAVLVGHLMVAHGAVGGGERELTLGGTYAIDARALPLDLDYIALGHLHRAQPLPGFTRLGRYAGSPMALDFSGDGASPSVALVEVEPGGGRVVEIPVTSGRQLVRIRGRIHELASMAARHPDSWFFCEVVSDEIRLDLVREVRELVPDALRIEPVATAGAPNVPDEADALARRDLGQAYAEWLAQTGRGHDDRLVAAFRAVLAHSEGEDG